MYSPSTELVEKTTVLSLSRIWCAPFFSSAFSSVCHAFSSTKKLLSWCGPCLHVSCCHALSQGNVSRDIYHGLLQRKICAEAVVTSTYEMFPLSWGADGFVLRRAEAAHFVKLGTTIETLNCASSSAQNITALRAVLAHHTYVVCPNSDPTLSLFKV